jgi:hypothetical protein
MWLKKKRQRFLYFEIHFCSGAFKSLTAIFSLQNVQRTDENIIPDAAIDKYIANKPACRAQTLAVQARTQVY